MTVDHLDQMLAAITCRKRLQAIPTESIFWTLRDLRRRYGSLARARAVLSGRTA